MICHVRGSKVLLNFLTEEVCSSSVGVSVIPFGSRNGDSGRNRGERMSSISSSLILSLSLSISELKSLLCLCSLIVQNQLLRFMK